MTISIPALREESDAKFMQIIQQAIFNFNPRSPWGERHFEIILITQQDNFNPRSPWGERPPKNGPIKYHTIFQSTLSVRRATFYSRIIFNYFKISIHALREESDTVKLIRNSLLKYFNPRSPWGERLGHNRRFPVLSHFNPRSPWGERQVAVCVDLVYNWFQSTLSVRRATLEEIGSARCNIISIHALREESD